MNFAQALEESQKACYVMEIVNKLSSYKNLNYFILAKRVCRRVINSGFYSADDKGSANNILSSINVLIDDGRGRIMPEGTEETHKTKRRKIQQKIGFK